MLIIELNNKLQFSLVLRGRDTLSKAPVHGFDFSLVYQTSWQRQSDVCLIEVYWTFRARLDACAPKYLRPEISVRRNIHAEMSGPHWNV